MEMGIALPPELHNLLEDQLAPGEKLRWCCQPKPNIYAWQTWRTFPFAIAATVFAFWLCYTGVTRYRQDGHFGLLLFSVPFVLVALLTVLNPLHLARLAGRTAYAVTDRRVIILENGRSTKVQSFLPDQLGELELRERADGWGNIIFAKVYEWTSDNNRSCIPTFIGLFGVPAVRDVEALIRDLVLGARQG